MACSAWAGATTKSVHRRLGVTIHVVTFESRNDNLYKILAEVTGGRHAVHGP